MQQKPAIYIIGAGAIGKVLAVLLKQQHKKVMIIRGSVDDHSHVVEDIEVEINNANRLKASVEITTFSQFSAAEGILVFTNKSFGNVHLAELFSTCGKNLPVVILQNGLDIEQPFIDNGFSQVYRAVLFATSQPVTKNTFRFKPVEASPIGIIKGNTRTLENIVQELSSPDFQFKSENNIQSVIWTKTIINCVFNSVCPLLETDNGIFYENEKALLIAIDIIKECISVVEKAGVTLERDLVLNKLLAISKLSSGQLISTYQDILNKRETEIESLNFAVVNVAKKFNNESSVIQTNLLGELVKLKAQLAIRNQVKTSILK